MLTRILFLFFFTSVIDHCFSQPVFIPSETKAFFSWGDKSTVVRKLNYGNRTDIIMINLHDDEQTSVEAAQRILERTGGVLIKIENAGERFISFNIGSKEYLIDPNRIFTSNGLRKNFGKLNNSQSGVAIKKIASFASFIIAQLPPGYPVIALHNNDAGRLTINSYSKNGDNYNDAAKVFLSNEKQEDDFFLTTDERIFRDLKKENYNVVLQDNSRAKDDGSLSIYFGRKRKPYVNVEAGHEHLQQQIDMLKTLIKILNK